MLTITTKENHTINERIIEVRLLDSLTDTEYTAVGSSESEAEEKVWAVYESLTN
jgi:hypothetical protein